MSASIMIEIPAHKITPKNFSCGEIIEGSDGEQYTIIDHIFIEQNNEYAVVLELVDENERVLPDFLGGTVEF